MTVDFNSWKSYKNITNSTLPIHAIVILWMPNKFQNSWGFIIIIIIIIMYFI